MFNWKRRYFKNKLRGVEKTICDLEFKRFKTREIREEVRQEYDHAKAGIAALEAQIRAQKANPDQVCPKHSPTPGKEGPCECEYKGPLSKDEVERLYDKIELLNRDSGRYLEQMKGLDLEVSGSGPTEEYPEGIQGINQQLEALRELKAMIKDYQRQL